MAGFEPTNAGIKIPCLTAWRHPNARAQARKLNGAGDKFRTCCLQSHNLALYRLSYARHILLVRLERFEPPTHGLEGRCSILLSYRRVSHRFAVRFALKALERVMGIGPTQPAWKASVLPLNYTRTTQCTKNYIKWIIHCQLILKVNKYNFNNVFKCPPPSRKGKAAGSPVTGR